MTKTIGTVEVVALAARVEKGPWCDDHSRPVLEQVSRQGGQSIDLIRRPAILDCHVPALDVTSFSETPSEGSDTDVIGFRRPLAQIADHRHRRLLRARREWPYGHAPSQRYEIPASHGRDPLVGADLIRAARLCEGPQSTASRLFARRERSTRIL